MPVLALWLCLDSCNGQQYTRPALIVCVVSRNVCCSSLAQQCTSGSTCLLQLVLHSNGLKNRPRKPLQVPNITMVGSHTHPTRQAGHIARQLHWLVCIPHRICALQRAHYATTALQSAHTQFVKGMSGQSSWVDARNNIKGPVLAAKPMVVSQPPGLHTKVQHLPAGFTTYCCSIIGLPVIIAGGSPLQSISRTYQLWICD